MQKNELKQLAQTIYGKKIRVRVCGFCIENNKILMLKHRPVVGESYFWCPPGGGISLGETAEEALKREFLEETGLIIEVGKLCFVNEFIAEPLHAIEMFFSVKMIGGSLLLGSDPEMNVEQQLIQNIAWLGLDEIKVLNLSEKHQFWQKIDNFDTFL